MYCKTHHPPTAEMKRAKKNAEYAAEAQHRAAAYKADAEAKAEMKRRSERFSELLEFAEEVRRSGDSRLASMAIAAIAKATGGQP